ncbi:thioredoxin domain-containing protein [Aeromonas bivalvium]|uniref:Thioredoxin n=1 Tax=Aeromonas bivalvium TaxID=440079 RepID=A0ABW9GV43_9GAMM
MKHLATGLAGALVLLLVAGGLGWYWWSQGARHSGNPWLRGEQGEARAQQLARESGMAMLYVIEADKCRRCKLLDKMLWQDPAMASTLAGLAKVRLNPGAGDGSDRVLRRFPKVKTPPGIYLQQAGGPLKPVQIVVDIQQIWMPGVTYRRGFFMPLSAVGFDAVLRTTLALEDPVFDVVQP